MTEATKKRQPLPALVFLVALCILAALVWWRVMQRGGSAPVATTSSPTATVSAQPPAQLPQPSAVTVRVVNNATGITGLARATCQALLKDGFNTLAAQNDSAANSQGAEITGTVELRYRVEDAAAADLLKYYFPGASTVPIRAQASPATVIVAIGPKFTSAKAIPTTVGVSARLKADGKSFATATPTKPAAKSVC